MTDFGTRDHYVGVMKGVILSIAPQARIVDISHDVYPHDITSAYFLLENGHRHFPDGTIFVAVVDPEVGSSRSILCVETARHRFLAPDNGILGFLGRGGPIRRIHRVTRPRFMLHPVSATFHGRDIFAPVAAHLALGLDPAELGPRTASMKELRSPAPAGARSGGLLGAVLTIDRFGNLATDLRIAKLARGHEIRVRNAAIAKLSKTYADVPRGTLLAYVGSSGTLEIAVSGGSAAGELGAAAGDAVEIVPRGRPAAAPPARRDEESADSVHLVETNLDNASGELVGFLFERLFEAGALDVFVTPIQMKKSRPAITLSALVAPDRLEQVEEILLVESPTFGLRRTQVERTKLHRETRTVKTKYGTIRVKVGVLRGRPIRLAPEYEDVRAAALKHRVPLAEVHRAATRAAESAREDR